MSQTANFNKYQIYEIVRSYAWKVKALQRLKNELEDVDCSSTAQYGIEATLPKGSEVGRPVEAEFKRREKKRVRARQYEEEIRFIIDRMDEITDEREQEMLDCLLDGYNVSAAGRHLGVSARMAHNIYESIIDKLAE